MSGMRLAVAVLLVCLASAGQSATTARLQGSAWIGRPLDLTVVPDPATDRTDASDVRHDPNSAGNSANRNGNPNRTGDTDGASGASSASGTPPSPTARPSPAEVCADAEVRFGDTRQDSSLSPAGPDTPARASVTGPVWRLRTTARVDEPVVTVLLRLGCNAPATRRFVLLADYPAQTGSGASAQTERSTPPLRDAASDRSPAQAPDNATPDALPAHRPAQHALHALHALRAEHARRAHAQNRRTSTQASPDRPLVLRADRVLGAASLQLWREKYADSPAPTSRAQGSQPTTPGAGAAPRDRLKLEPLALLPSDAPASGIAPGTLSGASAAHKSRGAPAWGGASGASGAAVPSPNASAPAPDMHALQAQLQTLSAQAAANERALAVLRARVATPDSPPWVLYVGAGGAALLLVALSGALWRLSRRKPQSRPR